ncbi:trigger factor [Echinicola vietnamensis]|uniref:Trigger factor n=1 Tax=Echinicola vietnamensis (strain DSM 17526 / LMG 23754 / KMM 6221) TaxID=926556 RepID=L0G710_ECHVK|nr:trigger factor [Echinicola vietnamensis]AGA80801.1 trigger factor [Echinicola vietnamensis DSM 17526]
MEIKLDKQSANQASIKINLNEADYQPKVDAKIKDYAKKANIKGFRPGKAPIGMVKKMYGTSVLVEEINDILSKSLSDYIKEQPFKLLGEPLPAVEDADAIDWKNQKEFEFEYKIGFVENVDVTLDKSIKATDYKLKVDKKAIDDAIANLRSQYGKMTNPEVSQENDFLYGDLKAADGSFEQALSLPLSKFDGRSVKKFIGVEKGAEIEFDPSKAIKSDLAEVLGVSQEEAEKVSGNYTFTVQNINRTEDADMDQEFFDKVFGPDQVKTEEEFVAKIEEILGDNYNKETKVFTEEKIKEALTEKANIELPEAFLKEWLIKANEGKVSQEDVEKEFPIYAKQLTWSLISNKIAEDNEIKAEHEDVIAKTQEMVREQLAASGLGSQMEDNMDMFVNNYLQGNEGQNYMQMLTAVQNDKVLDLVKEKITLKEEKIDVEKFKELVQN